MEGVAAIERISQEYVIGDYGIACSKCARRFAESAKPLSEIQDSQKNAEACRSGTGKPSPFRELCIWLALQPATQSFTLRPEREGRSRRDEQVAWPQWTDRMFLPRPMSHGKRVRILFWKMFNVFLQPREELLVEVQLFRSTKKVRRWMWSFATKLNCA